MMTDRPWMPLNIDDYLADTAHLSAAENGAYMLLIMRYWKDGGLPADERMIMRYSKLTADQWSESRDVLAAFFEDGWRHRRIDAELEKASGIIEKRRSAAKAKHASSKPDAHAEQVQSTCTDTRVPPVTYNQPSSLRSDGSRERRTNPIIVLQAVTDAVSAQRWVTHCEEGRKKPSAVQAEQQAVVLKDLRQLGLNPADAIRHAIDKGWYSLSVEYFRNAGFLPSATAPPPESVDWPGRIKVWHEDRTWAPAWGPKPGESGCKVPVELLERAAA